MKLSEEMQRCFDVLKTHKRLVRYAGGFWHIPDCEMKPGYNGGRIEYYVPIHPEIEYFGVGTIKALKKRGLIKTDKENKYGDTEVSLIEIKNETDTISS